LTISDNFVFVLYFVSVEEKLILSLNVRIETVSGHPNGEIIAIGE
jgi:hypothetical protein